MRMDLEDALKLEKFYKVQRYITIFTYTFIKYLIYP